MKLVTVSSMLSTSWVDVHCRFDRCNGAPVAIIHAPLGCLCWRDPIQALCAQHLEGVESVGPITILIDLRETLKIDLT